MAFPAVLAGLGFGASLIQNFANQPKTPNLSDLGMDQGQIKSFFDLKRAMNRASVNSNAANTTRQAIGALPTSLGSSTVPSSIVANIGNQAGQQIAQSDADIAGLELDAMNKMFDRLTANSQQDFQNSLAVKGNQNAFTNDITELLGLFALGGFGGGS